MLKFKKKLKRNKFRSDVLEDQIDVADRFFKKDKEIKAMRETYT